MRSPHHSPGALPIVQPLEPRLQLSGDDGVFIRTTRYGDTSASGTVNLADFNLLIGNVTSRAPSYTIRVEGRTLVVSGSVKDDTIIVDQSLIASQSAPHKGIAIRAIRVDAGAGNDTIRNETGLPSTLIGARGNDSIRGGGRGDHISGGPGRDTLDGGGGDDLMEGGPDGDAMRGDGGNDTLIGGADGDQLLGGSGNDVLSGGPGSDWLTGDDGDDVLSGDADYDQYWSGPGYDLLKMADGIGSRDRNHRWTPNDRDRIVSSDPDDVLG